MTRLYYISRDLKHQTRITAITTTDHGTTVKLAETIFCPKGGGQLSDIGSIAGSLVANVGYGDEDSIQHLVESAEGLKVGEVVDIAVDLERRRSNCRLHSAGHLIAQAAELMLPGSEAKQGHHWPGEARVEIELNGNSIGEDFLKSLGQKVADLVSSDLAITTTDGVPPPRTVTIDGFKPIGCGGTHVLSLAELKGVQLRKAKVKKGVLRIGYDA